MRIQFDCQIYATPKVSRSIGPTGTEIRNCILAHQAEGKGTSQRYPVEKSINETALLPAGYAMDYAPS